MRRILASCRKSGAFWQLAVRIHAPQGVRTLRCRVSSEQIAPWEPLKEGQALEEDAFLALCEEAEREACYASACKILASAPNSRRALSEKLSLRGYPSHLAEAACRALVARGYLDEEAQLLRLVEIGIKKQYSRRRLMAALLRKGYSRDAAMNALSASGYREEDVKRALLASLPCAMSEEEEQAFLARRGFNVLN